jgi:uncharacterized damage-inducible protein DinB
MEVEPDTQAFVVGLNEQALRNAIHYQNTKGKLFTQPLWQLMLHQANHATQHRSEAAVLLTGFGHSPGDLDLYLYAAGAKH